MNINTMILVFNILADTPIMRDYCSRSCYFIWGQVSQYDLEEKEWGFSRWDVYSKAIKESQRLMTKHWVQRSEITEESYAAIGWVEFCHTMLKVVHQ